MNFMEATAKWGSRGRCLEDGSRHSPVGGSQRQ